MGQLEDYFAYAPQRANYLTHIAPKRSAVFVEVPKAGCTAVKRLMQLDALDGDESRLPQDVHRRQTSPLEQPSQHDADSIFRSPHWFRFAFVRSPYTRALSCYLDKIAGSEWERNLRLPQLGYEKTDVPTFVEFLTRVSTQAPREMDIHWAPQSHLLGLQRVRYDFIGRFEHFQEDLRKVFARIGAPAPETHVKTRTSHATNADSRMTEFFSEEATCLVQSIYGGDFQRLGYGFDTGIA